MNPLCWGIFNRRVKGIPTFHPGCGADRQWKDLHWILRHGQGGFKGDSHHRPSSSSSPCIHIYIYISIGQAYLYIYIYMYADIDIDIDIDEYR